MPIIVGVPRSGTTLLRFMLDSHPQLAIPPETGFLPVCAAIASSEIDEKTRRETFFKTVTTYPPEAPGWYDFNIPKKQFWATLERISPFSISEGIRSFYRLYAERFNKSRWGDKTPLYCHNLLTIEQVLPEAHFIHIVRDGRDVALSLRECWFSPGNSIHIQATYWRDCILTAVQQGQGVNAYLEVFYEQLLIQPESVLDRICNFLNITYDEAMLRYYERTGPRVEEHRARYRNDGSILVSQEERLKQQHRTTQAPDISRISRWKQEMNLEERLEYEAIAGDLLSRLGYECLSSQPHD